MSKLKKSFEGKKSVITIDDKTDETLEKIAGASTINEAIDAAGADAKSFAAFVKANHLENNPAAKTITKALEKRKNAPHP